MVSFYLFNHLAVFVLISTCNLIPFTDKRNNCTCRPLDEIPALRRLFSGELYITVRV